METKASYFLVGLFVLTLIVGMFGFVIWLSRFELKDENTYYYVYFRGSVTGLSVGSTVRYRGVPVGTVTDIGIDSENVELIEVTLAIKRGTPIKTDTIASLQLQGITGLSFVQLTGGTRDAPLLEPRPGKRRATIPSRPSAIEQVFENAPEVFAQIATVAARANDLLSPENLKQIATILENSAVFTGALASKAPLIGDIVDDTAGTLSDLRRTAASLDQLARELRSLSQELGGDARSFLAETRQLTGEANRTVVDVRRTADSFERLARNLDRLVDENRMPVRDFTNNGLYELAQFLTEARTLVASLTRIAYQLERDPARFLFGDQQKGFQAR